MMPVLDPRRVFALVVGVESYQVGPGWSLPGPARDAVRFADWLTGDAGVPQANVHLLLSPLEQGRVRPSLPATSENVHRALFEELPQRDGDLLWIYWAGHGYLDARLQQLLPCTDATPMYTRHLNLQSALQWWRSSNVTAGRFRRVVAVCDTCRIETRRAKGLRFGTFEPEAGEVVPERRQFVLYAARPGEAARNEAEREAGQFTDTLLRHLEGKSVDDGVRGLAGIARDVLTDFRIMQANGEAWQQPQFVLSEAWDGSALFGDSWTDDSAEPAPGRARSAVLDQLAWTELGQLLSNRRLPPYSYDAYRWAFEVTGCAVPPSDALPSAHLLDIVRDLDSRQGRHHGLPLVLPFVRHLAARVPEKDADWGREADAWVDRTRARLGASPVPVPPELPVEDVSLHIRLTPDDNGLYWTRMWRYQRRFENVWESDRPLGLDDVRAELDRQLAARPSCAPTRIEFHVPYDLLDEPFESWPVRWRSRQTKELGCYFDVLLRCPDERQGLAEAPWHRKWAWFKTQGSRHPQAVRDVCDSDVSAGLGASLQQAEPPVCVFAEVTDALLMDTLDAVLDGGVPIAIWRRPGARPEETAEPIRTALAVDPAVLDVLSLPARLRQARIARRPLALMWDDPGRIPGRRTLSS
ncbi:hypothetical protein [Streptomyces sp. NPDC093094]|uniref:VMAP-C domain-containing protein n=1 Tax=Streptomyces sp. NPDC093094 TaxID=3366026 RepID=UPI00382EA868